MSVDRDRILEQALKHELGGLTTPTANCVDAETLAAWQDDALDASQMGAVELHVSTCPRCQSMLAAFARGSVAYAGTEPGHGTAGTLGTPGTFSWWRWWLAPIAAGAAAVTLWMVVPEQQQVATRPPAPPASVAPAEPQPGALAEEKKVQPQDVIAETRQRSADADTSAKVKADAPARDDRKQLKDQAPAAAPKQENATAVAQAPAAIAAPAPAAPPVTREEVAAGARVGELQKSAGFAFVGTEIVAPDISTRWRAGDRGIERSTDAGATWTLVHQDRNVSITAGIAPAPTICWLASANGFVYVSGDGVTFVRTMLPPPPPDYGWSTRIVSIAATDARKATVVTSDGTRFETSDGGRTWRLIPA